MRCIAIGPAIMLALWGCGGARTPAPGSVPAEPRASAPHAEQWYFWTGDNVRHYVYEVGDTLLTDATVIVLHGGWGAEHGYLVEPLSPLADRYRMVFYDQRGSLRSPAPDSLITLDRLVADLEHLRRTVGSERITLLAHSMGAQLAYAYLLDHPERVRGLVLVGPTLPARFTSGVNMEFARRVWPDVDSLALAEAANRFWQAYGQRALRVIDREGLLPDSLRGVPWDSLDLLSVHDDRDRTRTWRITFTAVNTCNPERWREMRGGMVYYSQRAANAILRDPTYAQTTERFWPALQRYEGPVRVIIGTCDYVDVGPMIWPRTVEQLQDARIQVVEEAGHSIWMDRPVEFEAAVREALREIH